MTLGQLLLLYSTVAATLINTDVGSEEATVLRRPLFRRWLMNMFALQQVDQDSVRKLYYCMLSLRLSFHFRLLLIKCLGKSGESEGNYVFPDADCSTLTTKIQ